MVDSKEEVMFIIGVYGQLKHLSKTIKPLLDLLTVNLVLNLYRFGKQLKSLQLKLADHIHQMNFYLMKDITLSSIL